MTIGVVSLFAGVGGFDLAARNLGMDILAAVEIDPQARGVLALQFPETKLFNDVREVTGHELRGTHTGSLILAGGFPCQDLSVAGKRAGLGGERSGLFWEIIRLAEELNPEVILLENVPGLLSSNRGRDMGTVVGALEKCGYRVGWRVLDAQHFGVPQRRRRVFIVAARVGADTLAEILFKPESGSWDLTQSEQAGQNSAAQVADSVRDSYTATSHGAYGSGVGTLRANGGDVGPGSETLVLVGALCARDYKGVGNQYVSENKLVIEASLMRMREGKPGGGKGPLLSEDASLTLATSNDQVLFTYAKAGRARTTDDVETWKESDITPTLNVFDNATESRATALAFSIREDAKADTFSVTPITVSNALQAQQPSIQSHHSQTFITQTVSDEPAEPDVLAFGHTQGLDIQAAVDAPTLRGGGGGGAVMYPAEAGTSIVRRLTPMECERLQGFPDNWTAHRIDNKTGNVIDQADSSRYRQMGNAVAVPVVEWLLKRITRVL